MLRPNKTSGQFFSRLPSSGVYVMNTSRERRIRYTGVHTNFWIAGLRGQQHTPRRSRTWIDASSGDAF